MSNNFKPVFHFSCPIGWMNDPNGFSFFDNSFHLFYQHYPKDTKWGPMHWGHATSKNLLNWQNEKIALYPDSPFDNEGCFSGTAIEENGKHILIYTGVSKEGDVNIQQQCIAIGDGKNYSKLSSNPVIKSSDVKVDFCKTDFRDPKIWKEGEIYFCIAVIKKPDDNGAIALFSSTDLRNWQFKNILCETNGELGGMWECPDYFKLDGKGVIILSPQNVRKDLQKRLKQGNNSVYMTGNFDKLNYTFTPDLRPENNFKACQIDDGIDFYAPQTMESPDGRRIMIGWMQAWESYITPKNHNWSGMMTLPRELFFVENCLYQRPVREYESMIKEWKKQEGIFTSDKSSFELENCAQFDLTIELDFVNSVAQATKQGKNPVISLTLSDGKKDSVALSYNQSENSLTFDRSNTIDNGGACNNRTIKLPEPKDKLKLRFIADTYSIETFINDGIIVFTNAFFLTEDTRKLCIKSEVKTNVKYKIVIK